MAKKVMGRAPYKFIYQIKVDGKWVACGLFTYYKMAKTSRRKKSNHNPKWVNN